MSSYRSRRRKAARAQSTGAGVGDMSHVPNLGKGGTLGGSKSGGIVSGFITKLFFLALLLLSAVGLGAYGTLQGWFNPVFERLDLPAMTVSHETDNPSEKELLVAKLEAEIATIASQINSLESIAAGGAGDDIMPAFPKAALLYAVEIFDTRPTVSISDPVSKADKGGTFSISRLWNKHVQVGERGSSGVMSSSQRAKELAELNARKADMRAQILEAEILVENENFVGAKRIIESLPLTVRAVASDWLDHMRKIR